MGDQQLILDQLVALEACDRVSEEDKQKIRKMNI